MPIDIGELAAEAIRAQNTSNGSLGGASEPLAEAKETSPAPGTAPGAAPERTPSAPSSEPTHPHPTSTASETSEHPAGEQVEDDLPFNWREVVKEKPELEAYVKQIQAGYTKTRQEEKAKLQEFEQKLSQYEGMPDDVKQLTDHLRAAYQVDPTGELAAQTILQIAQSLQPQPISPNPQIGAQIPQTAQAPNPGQAGPQFFKDQWGNWIDGQGNYVDEQMVALHQRNQQLEQQRKIDLLNRQADLEFRTLEQKHGETIPLADRQMALLWANKNGWPNPWAAWEHINREKLTQTAVRKAREEKAAIEAQKAQMPSAPQNLPSRAAPSAEPPKDLDGLIRWAIHKEKGR